MSPVTLVPLHSLGTPKLCAWVPGSFVQQCQVRGLCGPSALLITITEHCALCFTPCAHVRGFQECVCLSVKSASMLELGVKMCSTGKRYPCFKSTQTLLNVVTHKGQEPTALIYSLWGVGFAAMKQWKARLPCGARSWRQRDFRAKGRDQVL